MKYKEWLNKWLELYVKPAVKIRTYEKYEIIVRKHIIPALGEYESDNLTSEVLQRFIVKLTGVLSGNYINGIITVLQRSLKTAVMFGITKKCCADKIIRPKTQEKKIECFTISEQKKIEQAVFASHKPKLFGIVLCLYMGLRIGELLSLQWSDIDFKKGLLSVNKSCHWGKKGNGDYGQIIDSPKTSQSVRVIPLPKQLMPQIRNLYKNRECEYVISGKGKPVPVRSYQTSFEILLKKLKLSHRGFHSLRHTFATRAIECGIDVKTLSEILGHKNPDITLSRYCHSLMEHKIDMMNRLGKLFN